MRRTIQVQGTKTSIWEYGDPDKTLLVIIHGFPCPFSRFGVDTPIKYLKHDFHILGFDMPQFGYSKHIDMDVFAFMHDVIHQATGKDAYMLFGISFGGIIALQYAQKYWREIRGVIICGMPYYHRYPKPLLAIAAKISKFFNKRFTDVLTHFLSLDMDLLIHMKQPTLLLYSSKDKIAKLHMGRKLKTIIPKSYIVRANDRGHMALLDKSEQCNFLKAMYCFIHSFEINKKRSLLLVS